MAKPPGKRIAIRPGLKQGENGRINNNWRRLFLDHLAESSNVTLSATKAGISISRACRTGAEGILRQPFAGDPGCPVA